MLVHNHLMRFILQTMIFTLLAAFCDMTAFAQDGRISGDQDGSSQAVEESDEAYRRRMELEDARDRDPTYTDPPDDYRREMEKIDKLPVESRDNIRDQLIDIIVENPDWEPEDALEEYPYEPTAAAMADAELMQQEQEAWDEQIEKYHAREAAAYGAYRGAVAGPGNPQGGEGDSGAEGGSGQGGQSGAQGAGSSSSSSSAGTYQPYESQSEQSQDAVSTRGVSESALDFLLNRQQAAQQGSAPGQGDPQATAQQQAMEAAAAESASSEPPSSESPSESSSEAEAEPERRGILAIEDLDKMEGTGAVTVPPPEEEDESEQPPNDG
jgi:hypothetical protein